MSKLPRFFAILLALALIALPAAARDGGHGGGGHHVGHHHHFHGHGAIFLGGSFGLYDPFYYPYAYAPYPYAPYAYAAPGPGEAPANVWYFCPTANTYYPYVATCPVPWQLVQPY